MKNKQKVQAVITAGMAAALGVVTFSQEAATKQQYVTVLVNGTQAGVAADAKEAEAVIAQSRRKVMQETEGYAYLDAEVTVTKAVKKDTALSEKNELEDNITGLLKQQFIDSGVVAYTVTAENYSGNFTSREDAETFLEQVKDKTEGGVGFPLEVMENADAKGIVKKVSIGDPVSESEEKPEKIKEREPGAVKKFLKGAAPFAGVLADVNPWKKASYEEMWEETSPYAGAIAGIWNGRTQKETEEKYLDRTGIVAVDFADNVCMYENYVDKNTLNNPAQAAEEVTKEKETNKIYVVEAGDCLSTIAENFETTVDSIVALNELSGAEATVYADQEIIVAVPRPDISLQVSIGSIYEEEYAEDAVIVGNDSWYTTEENVLQVGMSGLREINAVVTYEQGVEVSREIMHTKVQREAVPAVIERGTKIPPTYVKPLSGGRFTSGFKKRWGKMHKGVDWATPIGTKVYASSDGVVTIAGEVRGYGYAVYISHSDGRQTRYGHNSKILVSPGQNVKQGDVIALSGNTGRSTGPHVHFEILIDGTQVNPLEYMN